MELLECSPNDIEEVVTQRGFESIEQPHYLIESVVKVSDSVHTFAACFN